MTRYTVRRQNIWRRLRREITESGLRPGFDIKRRARVDAQTIFQTGSTGKAMAAAALAVLVDEGKIAWDDPVIKHMPWFRMYDPWVTREITIRDLLVHRSGLGLGQGDLMFVPRTHLTRKQTIESAYVTFALDADGKVTDVTMKAVSRIADFSWDCHDLELKPVEDGK